jgi:hypothetical protein
VFRLTPSAFFTEEMRAFQFPWTNLNSANEASIAITPSHRSVGDRPPRAEDRSQEP